MRAPVCMVMAWLVLSAGTAAAHFNMLLPQTASAKKGEALTITYQWGHPFEHQLFDAPQPQSLIVLRPDGKRADLTDKLEKTTRKAGSKNVTAYQLRFTPQQRGDHIFVLRTPPIWMEDDGEFLQDTVKMVLHVQAQKGWDAAAGDFELMPLTRPYGLRPGMVFQVEMYDRRDAGPTDRRDAGPTDRRDAGPTNRRDAGPTDRRDAGPTRRTTGETPVPPAFSLVEIERYNATVPKKLPPDEHITRTVRLAPNGVATTTLTEPGWWCLTVGRLHGTRMRERKSYPLRQRSTLWVFVDEPGGSE